MTAAALPLRRTWLANEIWRVQREGTFTRLLRQLAPARLARCQGDVQATYQALLDYCETLFPTYVRDDWWWQEAAEMEGEHYDFAASAIDEGIPVNVMGLSYEDVVYGHVPPALVLAFVLLDRDYGADKAPDDVVKLLPKAELAAILAQSDIAHANIHPPRGRQWRAPWTALPELDVYVTHRTGCLLLDYSSLDVKDGMGNPPWNIDEIRGLAEDWKRGEPILEHVNALVDYIGRDRSRLLDLGRAITGDSETRQRLSVPKRKGKTLAQIFTGR